ncbi:hypothetical protein SAMN05518669_13342 [Variovorax sp. YR634]|nr:hypothetical protein SAMN05518669_13342 [Variovorax sp. YR634]
MARVTPGTGLTRTGLVGLAPVFVGFEAEEELDFMGLAIGGRKLIPEGARRTRPAQVFPIAERGSVSAVMVSIGPSPPSFPTS